MCVGGGGEGGGSLQESPLKEWRPEKGVIFKTSTSFEASVRLQI